MVHLAVKKLHANRNLTFFRQADNLFHGGSTIAQSPFVGKFWPAVARETDDIWKPRIRGQFNRGSDFFQALGMIRRIVQTRSNRVGWRHRANQPMLFQHIPLPRFDDIDPRQPKRLRPPGQAIE